MTITIKLDTGNDAFTDDKHAEVLRIVREHLDAKGLIDGRLRDYNGNHVGTITIKGR